VLKAHAALLQLEQKIHDTNLTVPMTPVKKLHPLKCGLNICL